MTSDQSSFVRLVLRANAVFSLGTGLLLAIAPATVGEWLGVSIDGWLRVLGLALVGHFVLLLWAASLPDVGPLARLNLLSIAPYPLLMIVLSVAVIDRTIGQVLLLVDGAVVGSLAVALWAGLRGRRVLAQSQPA